MFDKDKRPFFLAKPLETIMNKDLLKNKEAAEYIGVVPGTLPVWRHLGIGPIYLKIGRKVLYRKSDLDTYLESRVIKTMGGK